MLSLNFVHHFCLILLQEYLFCIVIPKDYVPVGLVALRRTYDSSYSPNSNQVEVKALNFQEREGCSERTKVSYRFAFKPHVNQSVQAVHNRGAPHARVRESGLVEEPVAQGILNGTTAKHHHAFRRHQESDFNFSAPKMVRDREG